MEKGVLWEAIREEAKNYGLENEMFSGDFDAIKQIMDDENCTIKKAFEIFCLV
jgi:hypothetical protein